MIEEITIGSSPCDEDCAQVGSPGYAERARKECRAYARQLIRMHGAPPESATIGTKSFSHDFGTYHEVVVRYDDSNEAASAWAYKLEGESPEKWDDEARKELGL